MYDAYATNTLVLDIDRCTGCGICVQVCPHAVFALQNRKAVLVAAERCMECGACALNCHEEALRVESGVGCATSMIVAALRGIPMDQATCG
jgi:ferredoxin